MNCKKCNKEVTKDMNICPYCGTNLKSNPKSIALGCLTSLGVIIAIFILTGILSDTSITSIENKVAEDAVTQYNIAKSQGDKMQICVQAGIVSAAYLQAKDQENYNKWKTTEKADCTAAGLPQ